MYQKQRERERERDRERQRETERERERENSNSKILILKDSSVWTYLTVIFCYTTNINKLDNTTTNYYKHD